MVDAKQHENEACATMYKLAIRFIQSPGRKQLEEWEVWKFERKTGQCEYRKREHQKKMLI